MARAEFKRPRPEARILSELRTATRRLRNDVKRLYEKTNYEDLEHADLGLQIVQHALEEVAEHKGKGGHIQSISDARAHRTAQNLVNRVDELQKEASSFLKTYPNEDLDTAIKALEISKGSLEEVVQRYQ